MVIVTNNDIKKIGDLDLGAVFSDEDIFYIKCADNNICFNLSKYTEIPMESQKKVRYYPDATLILNYNRKE